MCRYAAATAGNVDEAVSLFAAAKADADAYNKKLGGIMDEATQAHKNATIRFATIAEIATSEGGAGDQMMPTDLDDELEKLKWLIDKGKSVDPEFREVLTQITDTFNSATQSVAAAIKAFGPC